jgi:polysaccharide export outer membrane protein
VTPSLSRAFVTRNGKKIPVNLSDVVQKGQVQKDVPLEDQDVLTIPPLQSKVAVFGEVGTPGWYELPDDRDVYLSDALAKSGGILRSGVMASIVILKRDGPKTTKLTYDFRKYLKNADAKSNPKLEPDDIVVINASKRTDFEKLLAPLLSIGVINTIGKL